MFFCDLFIVFLLVCVFVLAFFFSYIRINKHTRALHGRSFVRRIFFPTNEGAKKRTVRMPLRSFVYRLLFHSYKKCHLWGDPNLGGESTNVKSSRENKTVFWIFCEQYLRTIERSYFNLSVHSSATHTTYIHNRVLFYLYYIFGLFPFWSSLLHFNRNDPYFPCAQ